MTDDGAALKLESWIDQKPRSLFGGELAIRSGTEGRVEADAAHADARQRDHAEPARGKHPPYLMVSPFDEDYPSPPQLPFILRV